MDVVWFDFQTIQGWAPALLCIFRILQGIAAGGEFSSAAVFVYEGVDAKERGKYAGYLVSGKIPFTYFVELCKFTTSSPTISILSGANAGTSLGIIIATSIRNSTSDQELDDWGWRIPFLLTPVVGGIALYFLYQLGEYEDDEEFKEAKSKSQQNNSNKDGNDKVMDNMIHDDHMWNVLKKYPWEILLLICSLGSWAPMVYNLHIYIHTYIHIHRHINIHIHTYVCTHFCIMQEKRACFSKILLLAYTHYFKGICYNYMDTNLS